MRLVNGSVLHFCHLSNEGKDMLTYQGAEIQWLYFDELTHFTKPMYDFIRSRVRAPDRMNIVPCVRCASNPGGPGHSWVKSYFVDATNIGETIITREVLLTARTSRKSGRFNTSRRRCGTTRTCPNPTKLN
ncbi:MAG: hypothetical protein ACLTV6_15995 [Christensenellales bacterium]